jgi:hypothetical protein
MNELIKELAEQAHDYCIHSGEVINYDDAFEQKFAELIVQECIEVIVGCDEDPKLVLHEPYRTIMNAVREYFGVE